MDTRLFFCVVLLLALCSISIAGNCSAQTPVSIKRGRVLYRVEGLNIVGMPVVNNVTQENRKTEWKFNMVVEREKTLQSFGGYACRSPTLFGGSPQDRDTPLTDLIAKFFLEGSLEMDPLEGPNATRSCTGQGDAEPLEQKMCGAVVGKLDYQDFDCTITHNELLLDGHPIDSIVVAAVYTGSARPFHFKITYEIAKESFSIPLNRTFSDTDIILNYTQDAVKITYSMSDYPWADNSTVDDTFAPNSNNATWISCWFNFSSNVNQHMKDVSVGAALDDFHISIFSSAHKPGDPLYSYFRMEVDTWYAINNKIHLSPTNSPFSDVPMRFEKTQNPFFMTIGIPICNDRGKHFDSFWYDPTLTLMFGGTDASNPSPKAQKQNKTLGIAVGVSLGITAFIVIVVIVLIIKVPAVRRAIRPFTARKDKAKGIISDSDEAERSPWVSSKTPLRSE